eukprot:TRINITY_DN460_c0_g1_i7.p1 TRINITY_DN460_c0_g1~~TRINITY_DN460_c0_g1_i7.p1  ORF type:complete len:1110 (-),score=400.14 TRINITY_DN460_c0_g1_i7:170-3112(-)
MSDDDNDISMDFSADSKIGKKSGRNSSIKSSGFSKFSSFGKSSKKDKKKDDLDLDAIWEGSLGEDSKKKSKRKSLGKFDDSEEEEEGDIFTKSSFKRPSGLKTSFSKKKLDSGKLGSDEDDTFDGRKSKKFLKEKESKNSENDEDNEENLNVSKRHERGKEDRKNMNEDNTNNNNNNKDKGNKASTDSNKQEEEQRKINSVKDKEIDSQSPSSSEPVTISSPQGPKEQIFQKPTEITSSLTSKEKVYVKPLALPKRLAEQPIPEIPKYNCLHMLPILDMQLRWALRGLGTTSEGGFNLRKAFDRLAGPNGKTIGMKALGSVIAQRQRNQASKDPMGSRLLAPFGVKGRTKGAPGGKQGRSQPQMATTAALAKRKISGVNHTMPAFECGWAIALLYSRIAGCSEGRGFQTSTDKGIPESNFKENSTPRTRITFQDLKLFFQATPLHDGALFQSMLETVIESDFLLTSLTGNDVMRSGYVRRSAFNEAFADAGVSTNQQASSAVVQWLDPAAEHHVDYLSLLQQLRPEFTLTALTPWGVLMPKIDPFASLAELMASITKKLFWMTHNQRLSGEGKEEPQSVSAFIISRHFGKIDVVTGFERRVCQVFRNGEVIYVRDPSMGSKFKFSKIQSREIVSILPKKIRVKRPLALATAINVVRAANRFRKTAPAAALSSQTQNLGRNNPKLASRTMAAFKPIPRESKTTREIVSLASTRRMSRESKQNHLATMRLTRQQQQQQQQQQPSSSSSSSSRQTRQRLSLASSSSSSNHQFSTTVQPPMALSHHQMRSTSATPFGSRNIQQPQQQQQQQQQQQPSSSSSSSSRQTRQRLSLASSSSSSNHQFSTTVQPPMALSHHQMRSTSATPFGSRNIQQPQQRQQRQQTPLEWSVAQTTSWLTQLELGTHVELFKRRRISIERLLASRSNGKLDPNVVRAMFDSSASISLASKEIAKYLQTEMETLGIPGRFPAMHAKKILLYLKRLEF